MPYILPERREDMDIANYFWNKVSPGDVNYLVSNIMNRYLTDNGISYTTINTLIGVLECAKLELYRRVASGYEDQKRHDNGEVYTCIS